MGFIDFDKLVDEGEEITPIARLAKIVEASVERCAPDTEGAVYVGAFWVKFKEDYVGREQFVEALREAHEGYYQRILIEDIKNGPSYIALGAWIGDQGRAMKFMGMGALLGLWKIFTPKMLGASDEEAGKMMGMGYILILPTEETNAL